MPQKSDSDRGRGFLTATDREFLEGDRSEYNEATTRQKWYRIYKRTRNAIRDFSLLIEHLSQSRLMTIFHPDDSDLRRELWYGMHSAMATFFLQQQNDIDHPDVPDSWFGPEQKFSLSKIHQNRLVERALREMLEFHDAELHEYEHFDYRRTPRDLQDLLRRFWSGDPLSVKEFEQMQREATTEDIRWQARVINESAFADNHEIADDDEVLLPRDRHLVWNRPLREDEEKSEPFADDSADSDDD